MFNIGTPNDRIKAGLLLPDIYNIFGDFWQTGELAILYGGTGTGKSILAVQIADGASKGEQIIDGISIESPPQPVLFLDFELSDKQFQVRYTSPDRKSIYQFSENFFMINIPFGEIYEPGKNLTKKIFDIIEQSLNQTNATVLIIDNITALSGDDNKDGNVAMEIMAYLDRLKRSKGISILIIGHTPKKFEFTPITNSDLAGSSKITQFSDAAFAIGKSKIDPDFRYLIQTKFSRSKKEAYTASRVLTIKKVFQKNCLKFEYEGEHKESEHLEQADDKKLQAIALKNQGLSYQEIADKLGVSKGSIHNWTKNEKGHQPFKR